MSTVTAIYENGVFRPLEKVTLPEHTEVEISVTEPTAAPFTAPTIEEIMSFRYDGEPDEAERADPARKQP
jgi:predicted DNA-binding antitoxin AbrB/MazE fold protein